MCLTIAFNYRSHGRTFDGLIRRGACWLADPPGPPSAPTVDDVTKDSCQLSWRPPDHDGGSPVTGYHVERSASGRTDRWIRITRQPVPETRYTVSELVEGNDYQFRVAAENAVGVGPPGPESDSITAKDPWGQLLLPRFQSV